VARADKTTGGTHRLLLTFKFGFFILDQEFLAELLLKLSACLRIFLKLIVDFITVRLGLRVLPNRLQIVPVTDVFLRAFRLKDTSATVRLLDNQIHSVVRGLIVNPFLGFIAALSFSERLLSLTVRHN